MKKGLDTERVEERRSLSFKGEGDKGGEDDNKIPSLSVISIIVILNVPKGKADEF